MQSETFTVVAVSSKESGAFSMAAKGRALNRRLMILVLSTQAFSLLAGAVWVWRFHFTTIDLSLLIGMFILSVLGITVGFHRQFTHRSFQTTRTIKIILATLGSMAAQGPLLFWAAVHRHHHACSDQPGDPHSPTLHEEGLMNSLRSFWHAHVGWMFSPEVSDWALYVPDLLKDRTIFKLHRLYPVWVLLGLAVPTLAGALLAGSFKGAAGGFLWGGLIRITLAHHMTWSINSICHLFGSRTFRSDDSSANNFWLAISTFGESWHNNHHAFPSSAFHGLRWWQIDLAGIVIRLLRNAGLAWNVKAPAKREMQESRLLDKSFRNQLLN